MIPRDLGCSPPPAPGEVSVPDLQPLWSSITLTALNQSVVKSNETRAAGSSRLLKINWKSMKTLVVVDR